MRAKGEDAPPQPTGLTEMERTYIGIGVAVGVLAIIVLISVAVVSHSVQKVLFILFSKATSTRIRLYS